MAYSYDRRVAAVTLKELPQGGYQLIGDYQDMRDIIPTLKRQKWWYDGSTKSWSIRQIGPRQLKEVQRLISPTPAEGGVSAAAFEKFRKEVSDIKGPAVEFEEKGDALHLKWLPTNISSPEAMTVAKAVLRAGGQGSLSHGWDFTREVLDAREAKTLPAYLQKVNEEAVKARAKAEEARKELEHRTQAANELLPARYPNLGVSVILHNGLVLAEGKTYPVKDFFSRAGFRWQNSRWSTSLQYLDIAALEKVLRQLAKLDAEQQKTENPADTPTPSRPNRRGDHCRNCGAWVPPGEGYLISYYDDEEGDVKYGVIHRDKKVCETVREEVKERARLQKNKNEARRQLRDLGTRGDRPTGRHDPQGKRILLDDKNLLLYGGGTWVVVEPDQKHYWYVQNNGADGDDWSQNNLDTGGAGAIGWRNELTPEAKMLIESISGESID